ncbi:HAD family hydrolase [Aliiruegeria lutimaris]|uniref:phosphoglycolate phosphatase n=1 Tax=Aliiruegeria lutimaris TaxID=571298 RepID=A0A1G8RID7_9RHOB|nr:HAD-IA family hydrolase [Aliiruegeria lutimaris]SDJ16130.1 haloacid dehalogenase superfamily, subfamily IA, variant 3 with third motif having DD or ED [Aliiruegeria lutimaris]
MERPDAIIFDLDGVLVDSEPMSLASLAAEMRAVGVADATSDHVRAQYLGVSLPTVKKDVAEYLGAPCPDDFEENYLNRLYAAYDGGLRRIDEMVAALDRFQAEGIATCIASGGSLPRIRRTLAFARLTERFGDRIFSGEDVARGKPAPDLVLHAAMSIGVAPSRCLVIEDSPHGVEGARAAGMRAVGFTGGSHLETIREQQAQTLRNAGAEAVFRDAADVQSLVLAAAAA